MKSSSLCNGCNYGWSAWICIVAGLLWLFTALALYTIPDKAKGGDDAPPGSYAPNNGGGGGGPAMATTGLEQREVTRTPQPDGSTLVVTRITTPNPDGSKTVAETSEVEKA
jgi:hypothetical protein